MPAAAGPGVWAPATRAHSAGPRDGRGHPGRPGGPAKFATRSRPTLGLPEPATTSAPHHQGLYIAGKQEKKEEKPLRGEPIPGRRRRRAARRARVEEWAAGSGGTRRARGGARGRARGGPGRGRAAAGPSGGGAAGRARAGLRCGPRLWRRRRRRGKMLQSLAGSSCVRLVERHRSAWCFGFLVLGYLLYLVFGAVVFSSVELPYEDLLRQELRKLKRRFLEEHECLSEQQLEQFLGRVLEASNYGVSVLSNASGNWNWDFTSALFFASTVLSTTGRGPPPRPPPRPLWPRAPAPQPASPLPRAPWPPPLPGPSSGAHTPRSRKPAQWSQNTPWVLPPVTPGEWSSLKPSAWGARGASRAASRFSRYPKPDCPVGIWSILAAGRRGEGMLETIHCSECAHLPPDPIPQDRGCAVGSPSGGCPLFW